MRRAVPVLGTSYSNQRSIVSSHTTFRLSRCFSSTRTNERLTPPGRARVACEEWLFQTRKFPGVMATDISPCCQEKAGHPTAFLGSDNSPPIQVIPQVGICQDDCH